MRPETNVYDFLIEALRAEGMTWTGRYNILLTVLLVAIVLLSASGTAAEIVMNALLSIWDKGPVEVLPDWFLKFFSIATVLISLLCLWIVRDMEIKKNNIYGRD